MTTHFELVSVVTPLLFKKIHFIRIKNNLISIDKLVKSFKPHNRVVVLFVDKDKTEDKIVD